MEEYPLNMFEMILVVTILVVIVSAFFGTQNLQAAVHRNLTQPLVLTIISADAEIARPEVIGGTYFYDVTVVSKMVVAGNLKEGQNVIAIIKFKDHSQRAKVDGKVFFTIKPEDDIVEHKFHVSFSTDVPPITAHDVFSDELRENQQILIRSGTGAALVSVNVDKSWNLIDPLNGFSVCEATFRLEGGCVPWKIKYTYPPMTGCEDETNAQCRQSVDLCNGIATIQIFGKPDCASNKVTAQVEYEGGEKFDAGEIISVSFWKAGCPYESDDHDRMKVQCEDYRVGGDDINAGIVKL